MLWTYSSNLVLRSYSAWYSNVCLWLEIYFYTANLELRRYIALDANMWIWIHTCYIIYQFNVTKAYYQAGAISHWLEYTYNYMGAYLIISIYNYLNMGLSSGITDYESIWTLHRLYCMRIMLLTFQKKTQSIGQALAMRNLPPSSKLH